MATPKTPLQLAPGEVGSVETASGESECGGGALLESCLWQAESRSLHLVLQLVSTKIPDILDKPVAGGSQIRWLESGHHRAFFATSDIKENK